MPGLPEMTPRKDEDDEILSTHVIDSENGKFSFKSDEDGGEYHVCVTASYKKKAWFGNEAKKIRFGMRIDTGEHAVDYEELAKKEHLTGIEVELRMLTNKLEAVRAEQKYQWRRERQFRNTSESTYERILWWNIGQCLLLLLTSAFMYQHLKRFLKGKKVI